MRYAGTQPVNKSHKMLQRQEISQTGFCIGLAYTQNNKYIISIEMHYNLPALRDFKNTAMVVATFFIFLRLKKWLQHFVCIRNCLVKYTTKNLEE